MCHNIISACLSTSPCCHICACVHISTLYEDRNEKRNVYGIALVILSFLQLLLLSSPRTSLSLSTIFMCDLQASRVAYLRSLHTLHRDTYKGISVVAHLPPPFIWLSASLSEWLLYHLQSATHRLTPAICAPSPQLQRLVCISDSL